MPSASLSPTRPTVAIDTHGCKLNQADSQVLSSEFVRAGFRLVSPDDLADVYVLNTCTVTHVADSKARHSIRAAKRRNPNATIVATGCYAQRAPTELRALEEVDMVVGNVDKPVLVRQVLEWRDGAPVPCAVGAESEGYSPTAMRTRAMVKIQEGCNQVCAYCIVPKVRGRERSIPPDQIIGQINRYVAMGYKEAVLTGTQLGTYGFDLPETDLTALLEGVLSQTELARVRVSSLQPQEVHPRMLELWSNDRMCPHFHLPLQSGSGDVLKRMRRRYTPRLYVDAVEMIRQHVPDASITADVIVGFPGETDGEFEETIALCEEVGFAAMHVFPYSIRPGTSAAHFQSQVGPPVKHARVQRLLKIAESQAEAFRERFVGTTRAVLWEDITKASAPAVQEWSGLTDNYIRVASHSDRSLANQVTPARLVRHEEGLVYAQAL